MHPPTQAPPPGFTGGFEEPSCVACHVGNAINAFDGHIRIEGLPDRYTPGAEYLLTVVLEAEGTAVAGFQISARYTDGDRRGRNAGALHPADARSQVTDSASVSYLHQNAAGSVAFGGFGSSWSLIWIAPDTGDRVTINVAGNSGNADNSPLGDLVFTTERTIDAASTMPLALTRDDRQAGPP